ncbi:polyhomeotic-like protein 3 [Spea bombifrons]|uniref:polyhomeotic-like protein 3 n=1 Tax=Spea bombifrons TaxID=233779 RepID=UPI00234ABAAF|nr:polyhomeotic-like protein 3 [Spea bombifrons]
MENEQVGTTCAAPATTSTSTAPVSMYSSSDRHAVQVIQQTLNRPPSSAAQYLQQMYAAQQQHLMLQTAALQQQHLSSTQLQSLASVQQASVSGERRSASPVTITQQSNVSQPSLNLSTSPPPPQIMSRSQTSSTTSSTITQKTMLLGSTSPTLSASQAQMYLRAQMLIFTPTATVAAVQSDIPVISSSSTSSSCQSTATQVQNLTLRNQPMIEMSCSQGSPPKISNPDQPLAICHKTTITSSKAIHSDLSSENTRKGESPAPESRCTAVTRAGLHQLITPVSYSPIHPHSLGKYPAIPLHPDTSKLPHHHMILQQQQQIQHRHQIQTITLHNPNTEPHCGQHCIPIASMPIHSSAHSHHCTPVQTPPPPSPTLSQSAQQSVVVSPPPNQNLCQSPSIIFHPQALIQSQPPLLVQSTLPSREHSQNTLHSAPQLALPTHITPALSPGPHREPLHQQDMVSPGQQIMSPVTRSQPLALQQPPPTASSAQLPTSPPAQLQPLPLQSMQAIAVQPEMLTPGQVLMQNALLSEEELPAAEALVQLPFQALPPPQTVAVNLHIEPAQAEAPVVYQVENVCSDELPVVQQECVRVVTHTPTPPTMSPPALPVGSGEEVPVDHILQGLPSLASSASASVIKSPSDSSHASIPAPPLLLPAATTRTNSALKPNSIPVLDNKLPQAIVRPQVLTHVIEGFVIQEGIEPFPVSRSSLLVEETCKGQTPPDENIMNIADMEPENQSMAKLPDNTTDTDMEDLTTEEGVDEPDGELLECEFCGKTGYPNKFLRSKRFCSQTCAKRYNVNGTKRSGLFKTDKSSRWSRKMEGNLGRRGRRPSSTGGLVREHYLRQLPTAYSHTDEVMADAQEDSVPVAMTTRLRRQSEREHELRLLQTRNAPPDTELPPDAETEPSLWTVEDVWAFIRSLPGCHDIAEEFRIQEIDGQALLLLKEDHLMSTMNIKLGPALKICAQINSLKET